MLPEAEKSLTLKSIAELSTQTRGHIQIGDHVLYGSDSRICLKPQRNVGYVPEYGLFPTMTVGRMSRPDLPVTKEKQERVQKMIRHFPPGGTGKRLPRGFPAGSSKRIALAGSWHTNHPLFFSMNHFSALDVFFKDRLQQEMMELLSDYDGTVILVSRDEIYRFSEELLVIDDGNRSVTVTQRQSLTAQNRWSCRLTGCKNIVRVEVG